jgi:fido (protein-threonine AMPylation protein)
MTHPFEDGNSRSSRIAMISYLDFLSKKDFKFFTFITNFSSNLSSSSYNEFLKENIYSEYNKFRSKIKISDE